MMAAAKCEMAAVNTSPPGDPKYIDLAKTGAHISRPVAARDCERLDQVVAGLRDGNAQLTFSLDEHGEVVVRGTASMVCEVDCQLCLRPKTVTLAAEISGVVTAQPQEGRQTDNGPVDWDAQPIIVSGADLNVIELVEDELLLQVPTQVCKDSACEYRPALSYAAAGTQEQAGQAQDHPFEVLRELKLKQDK